VDETFNCASCGGPLIAGRCLACDARRLSRFVHREVILLLVLGGITLAAFYATRAIAQGNETLRHRQAAAWYEASQSASVDGEKAVAALRRAVLKDPAKKRYRLALAEALMANRQDSDARQVLIALREAEPEDPETNVQLARLEARGPDANATRRYYQSALAGLWKPEQSEERSRVRIDLIRFLLAKGEQARALSEVLVLAANTAPSTAAETQIGGMFLAAGDPGRALDHFGRALRLDPNAPGALAGAGESAFQLGDYRRALRYLNAASQNDARIADLRDVTRLVLAADPLAPRLASTERERRLSVALQQAVRRLEACIVEPSRDSSGPSLEPLRAEALEFQSTLGAARRRRQPVVDDGVDLVYRIERGTGRSCPTSATPLDRALLLIGRSHGFDEQ